MRHLLAAIISADGLINFRFANASPFEFKKSKDGKKINYSCDGEKKNSSHNIAKQGNPQGNKSLGCFI